VAADGITTTEVATAMIEPVIMAAGGAGITERLTLVALLMDPAIALTPITTIGDTGTRTPAATPLVTNIALTGISAVRLSGLSAIQRYSNPCRI
jgi:hypothetical protein